jgi:RND family efflux transporter MFP subunit
MDREEKLCLFNTYEIKYTHMKNLHYLKMASLALVLFACKQNDQKEEGEEVPEKIFPVKIETLKKQAIERTLDYTANLMAFKEVHYAPAAPGRIDKIHVEVGSRITKGQVLVESDRTQLVQAATQYENAKSNFQRVDTLFQLGSISEQQYEQAKTHYEVALSSVEFLKENTTLTSPINGIVTGKYFENGEFYSGVPNTQAGKAAVISLMQINKLKALVSVSERYFPHVKKGMTAVVSTDVYPSQIFDATVNKIHPVIDQSTRTFQVELLIQNQEELLRPGMFSRISFSLSADESLLVPAIAVLKQDGTNNRYVFIHEDGEAQQIPVKIGKRENHLVEILSSEVQEGMELIIDGQANLLQGSRVVIVSE